MIDYVAVDFLFDTSDAKAGDAEVRALGKDFILISSTIRDIPDVGSFLNIRGKINSETATVIKLGSNKFLADHMQIYFIPNEVKNRYRDR